MAKSQHPLKGPKTLIYDIDRGMKSLASDERIEEVFGYKPRRFIRTGTMDALFTKLHEPAVIETEDALGTVEEEVFKVREGIEFEVLDSLTAFQAQTKKEVKGGADRITLPQWGEIGETLEALVLKLCRTNTNVIILGHVKSESDNDLGVVRFIPALSGRMQHEIGRYFDIVFFTRIELDSQTGQRQYLWQVLADERRSAKCRIEEVSKWAEEKHEGIPYGCMPQDFTLLFALAKDYPAIKILILGESGTGKTRSLRTLTGIKPKETV